MNCIAKKKDVTFSEIETISLFAQLNTPVKIFQHFWNGAYIGIAKSISNDSRYFFTQRDKNPRHTSISWLINAKETNAVFVLMKMYGEMYPDNKLFQREVTSIEIGNVVVAYNLKFNDDMPMSIGKVFSLFYSLVHRTDPDNDNTIMILKCGCGNHYTSRLRDTSVKRCQWCRKGIKKTKGRTAHVDKVVNLQSLSSREPQEDIFGKQTI